MKFFETIVMNLAKCYYFPNQKRLFDTKRLLVTIIAFLIVISNFAYLFYEVNTVIGYVRFAYMFVTVLGIFVSFLSTIIKTKTIFILIDSNIGNTITQSEYFLEFYFFLNNSKMPIVIEN